MTRVLVVDDIETNVILLAAKLRAKKYVIVTASSGAGAVEKAKSERPDIILLDVMMPEMDGYEACAILKKTPETRHIPVVMVTALDRAADRADGLAAGADGYVTKPVDDATLFERINALTGKDAAA